MGAFISSCGHQQKINAYHFETNKRIEVQTGAVVSASPIASEVGVSILKQGGNAVDAAIATQFALGSGSSECRKYWWRWL